MAVSFGQQTPGVSSFLHSSIKYLLIATLTCQAWIAAAGTISGRVANADGQFYFEGAQVTLVELDRKEFSKAGGRFEFDNIPPGEYTLAVHYVGSPKVEESVTVDGEKTSTIVVSIGGDDALLETVIVYGQAANATSSLNQQRAADGLLSVLSSDAIGNFPDANVSEALQRVSGVFIERDQGEGRFVGIRGLEPNLNVAKINGITIAAPERDRRSVALDVIPSDLLERIEVKKSVTPDQDGDAIGGTIDIKSLSAFDRDRAMYKVSAKSDFNALQREFSPKFNTSFTNVIPIASGDLGIAMSASWQERTFGSDNIETDGGWNRDIEDSGYAGAEEIEQRDYTVQRDRSGFALNLDYMTAEGNLLYLRTLYSGMSDQEYRQRIEYKLDKGDLESIDENSAIWSDIDMDRELKDRYEEQNILSWVAGGDYTRGDWKFDYSVGLSDASEEEPNRRDIQFSEDDAIASAGYRSVGSNPTMFYSANGGDPNNFEFDELVVEDNLTKDRDKVFKFDARKKLPYFELGETDVDGHVKFGTQQRTRKKSDDINVRVYDGGFTGDPTLNDFLGAELDYGFGDLGLGIDIDKLNAYIDRNIDQFELDSDETSLSSARDYVMTEDISAGYGLVKLNIGSDLRVVTGVRFESTDTVLHGYSVIDDNGDPMVTPLTFDKDYANWLPSLTMRYRRNDNTIVRFAYSHTIARPSFGDINPSPDKIEIDDEDLEIEAGNSLLDPYLSKNFDISMEYYGDKNVNAFSVGAFIKDIDNFIFLADVSSVADHRQWTGGADLSAVTDFDILQPRNGSSARLKGVEAAWTQNFGRLGNPWNRFLLSLNGTWTSSDANLGLGPEADRSSSVALPRQADVVGNAIIGYSHMRCHLRLAYAYKGERLLEIDFGDEANDLYQQPHGQWDFTARVDVTDQLEIFFNAINLTDEPYYAYFGNSRYNGQYETYGISAALGFTFRNL